MIWGRSDGLRAADRALSGVETMLREGRFRDLPGAMAGLERAMQGLQSAGYTTGHFGKWHIGREKPYRPENRGFDESYGIEGGGTPKLYPTIYHNGVRQKKKDGYATDLFFEKAFAWIGGKPKGLELTWAEDARMRMSADMLFKDFSAFGPQITPTLPTRSWIIAPSQAATPSDFFVYNSVAYRCIAASFKMEQEWEHLQEGALRSKFWISIFQA